MSRHMKLLLVASVVLVLAACNSTTPPVDTPDYPVSGKFLNAGDVPMPNFMSLGATHPSVYVTTATALDAQAVDYGSLLAIASSPVAADGSFEWDLGDGSDIPAGYMSPANQAFQVPPFVADVTCISMASAPVSVLRSFVIPGGMITPVGIVGPLSGSGAFAEGVAIYTDVTSLTPAPTEPFNIRSWIFASGDVTITASCQLDNGVDPVTDVVTVDVDLTAGWNEVTALVDGDAMTTSVSDEPFDNGAWLFLPGTL